MPGKFSCTQKTILNYRHNLGYVNKRCKNVLHDLSKNLNQKNVPCCLIAINLKIF